MSINRRNEINRHELAQRVEAKKQEVNKLLWHNIEQNLKDTPGPDILEIFDWYVKTLSLSAQFLLTERSCHAANLGEVRGGARYLTALMLGWAFIDLN